MFRAELVSCDQISWEALFDGFTALRGITLSSSPEILLHIAERLDDMEIVLGSETILSMLFGCFGFEKMIRSGQFAANVHLGSGTDSVRYLC